MKCPFCSHIEDRVIDSRIGKEGEVIRRRRECLKCGARFTTYERIEEVLPLVVKKDNRRETFDRAKLLSGIKKACEKRPVSVNDIEAMADDIERLCQECGEKEVQSSMIGEAVMERLKRLDEIAYVRFASVYREFKDSKEFMDELKELLDKKR